MIAKLRALTKKQLAIAAVAVSIIGTVGVVGVSNAAPAGKPTKEQCAQAGFQNYGECVSSWANGGGYSGSGSSQTVVSEFRERKVTHTWSINWRFW